MQGSLKWCMRLTAVVLCLLLAVPAAAAERETGISGSMVAVRSGASEYAAVIGWLPDGETVKVLDSKYAYYRIDCYDMTGYIHKELVEQTEEGYVLCAQTGHGDTAAWMELPQEKVLRLQEMLCDTALSMRGVPYVWGGTTPRGFDCSGFTQYVYRRNGLTISRTCEGQLSAGMIVAKEDLQPGDLILFQGTAGVSGVSHVGMYLGDGKLIHAGSRGITVVELANSYFTRHYMCARRILIEQSPEAEPVDGMSEILFSE